MKNLILFLSLSFTTLASQAADILIQPGGSVPLSVAQGQQVTVFCEDSKIPRCRIERKVAEYVHVFIGERSASGALTRSEAIEYIKELQSINVCK